MVSQTVLLKGINDDSATLMKLMRKLVEHRIKPYYLHHTDLAPGTSHFRVSIEKGQAIMRDLRANLSGIAQPTYVLDIPGAHGKVPIGPSYIRRDDVIATDHDPIQTEQTRFNVEAPDGSCHVYNDPT